MNKKINDSLEFSFSEKELRNGLGIPEDAAHILIFAESSHWDPDWLYTSDT